MQDINFGKSNLAIKLQTTHELREKHKKLLYNKETCIIGGRRNKSDTIKCFILLFRIVGAESEMKMPI